MAAWRAWQTHWLTTGLQAVEQRLALDGTAGAFCFGDDVTVADICLASILVVAEIFGISVPNIPTIDRIGQRCFALDAFARAHPLRQQGAPEGG
jgi:glutathione S-transferase